MPDVRSRTADQFASSALHLCPPRHIQALWRLYALLRVDREQKPANYASSQERKLFHALVALYALLETAAAASECT